MKGCMWSCPGPVQGSSGLYQKPEQLGISLGNAISERRAMVAIDVGAPLDQNFSQWHLLMSRPGLRRDRVAHSGGGEWETLATLEQFLQQLEVPGSQRALDGSANCVLSHHGPRFQESLNNRQAVSFCGVLDRCCEFVWIEFNARSRLQKCINHIEVSVACRHCQCGGPCPI